MGIAMSGDRGYLLDADVLITAKRRYYAFSICPGFWSSLLHRHAQGSVFSIDRVKQELMGHNDDLSQWVRQHVPAGFFVSDDDEAIKCYHEIIRWAESHSQYVDEAKRQFANSADGWLVAHAKVSGKIVVTNEQSSPKAIRKIKLPDVCDVFSVPCSDTFGMLHALGVQYHF